MILTYSNSFIFSYFGFPHGWLSTGEKLVIAVFVLVILVFGFLLWRFIKRWLKYWKQRKQQPSISPVIRSFAVLVFVAGVAVYYTGYDYAGTGENILTLLMRSVLSSLEMFLSKSNLIGIADNCKGSPTYMFLFAAVHALALATSTVIAVACFRKRLIYWWKGFAWGRKTAPKVNVFFSLNERSLLLAEDMQKTADSRERFVFVDVFSRESVQSKSLSFSGLLDLFSFNGNAVRKLSHIKRHILMRTSVDPASVSVTGLQFFEAMGLSRLSKIIAKSGDVDFFLLSENEDANVKTAIHILDGDVCGGKEPKVFCAARKTALMRMFEERYGNLVQRNDSGNNRRLNIIDDSRAAVSQLKSGKLHNCYPVDYVDIDPQSGLVTSGFNALIVGFGTTGQDALRFLYEFSAFPGIGQEKSPVRIDVVDSRMDEIRGIFGQEVPAMSSIEGNEIFLHNCSVGSVEFSELLDGVLQEDNSLYVVVSAGSADENIRITSLLMEYASRHRKDKGKGKDNFMRLHIFVRLYSEDDREKYEMALAAYNQLSGIGDTVVFFGDPRSIYTRETIIDDNFQRDAETYYDEYCEATGVKRSWTERRRNTVANYKGGGDKIIFGHRELRRKEGQDYANCRHRYTKEKLLGIVGGTPIMEELPETISDLDLSSPETEVGAWHQRLYNASICEHLRWNAAHLMMGYLPMPPEDGIAIDSTCNDVTLGHICIVPWPELPKLPKLPRPSSEETDCQNKYQYYDYKVVYTTVKLKVRDLNEKPVV